MGECTIIQLFLMYFNSIQLWTWNLFDGFVEWLALHVMRNVNSNITQVEIACRQTVQDHAARQINTFYFACVKSNEDSFAFQEKKKYFISWISCFSNKMIATLMRVLAFLANKVLFWFRWAKMKWKLHYAEMNYWFCHTLCISKTLILWIDIHCCYDMERHLYTSHAGILHVYLWSSILETCIFMIDALCLLA